jgi:hypothetical protein
MNALASARSPHVARLVACTLMTLAALAPLAAHASPPPAAITVDCARPSLPSQQDIARLTGVDNFGQAYAVRARLMAQAQRACQSPVGKVQLVVVPEPAKRLVAR